jgi:two-component system sensor histidine kinase RegB
MTAELKGPMEWGALQPRPLGMVRLRTLVLLRWLAVVGQAAAVLAVHFVFRFEMPLVPVWLTIFASAALNIALVGFYPLERLARPNEAAAHLAFDIFQLTVLTGLTGGLDNPFVMLLVAPVAIAASVLPRQHAFTLGALTAVCAASLMVLSLPLPWMNEGMTLPFLYHAGVLVSLLIAIAFAGLSASRGAVEAERMSAALAATQTVLAREERLAALGGLAAAAAHELGTPLATIQLTAKEMVRALPPEGPLADDARLLVEQAERCRDILARLSRGGLEDDEVSMRAELPALLEEAAAPLREIGPRIVIRIDGEGRPPVLRRGPETLFVLETLLENAVDFASAQVEAIAQWDDESIGVTIEDDGPGFAPEILPALGEPYLTTRRGGEGAGGLGLGVFIARALIARVGGRIDFSNKPDGGARAIAVWPRARVSAKNQDLREQRPETELARP